MRTSFVVVVGVTVAAVSPAVAPAQNQTADGAQVYAATCGRCHNARSPLERSDREWAVITAHMRVRGNLTGSETRAVQAFLQQMNGLGGAAPAATPIAAATAPVVLGPVDSALAAQGWELVGQGNCSACHKIGTSAAGTLGPDLNTVLGRRTADFVLQKLADPGADNPNSMMPPSGFTAEQRRAVLEYLRTVQR